MFPPWPLVRGKFMSVQAPHSQTLGLQETGGSAQSTGEDWSDYNGAHGDNNKGMEILVGSNIQQ